MIPSISTLSQSIPSESLRVKTYFNAAIVDEEITTSARYQYGIYSIVCSGVNVALYTLHIPTRFITALFYVDLTEISQGCPLDARRAFDSLYYSVGMTAFLFATCISSRFALKHVLTPEETHLDLDDSPPTSATETSESPIPPNTIELSKERPHSISVGQRTLKGLVGKKKGLPKEMKYRHIFAQLVRLLNTPDMVQLEEQISQLKPNPLQKQCLKLSEMIKSPSNLEITRVQYKEFVKMFREITKDTAQLSPPDPCAAWAHHMSITRFTRIPLYGYCEQLMVWASGKFEKPLTLENFWEDLVRRNSQIKDLTSEEGLNSVSRDMQKLKGHLNWLFDPLKGSNIPRLWGEIVLQNKKITILQHGVPIKHSDVPGLVKRFFNKRFFSIGKNTIPDVTTDYRDFIRAALGEGKKILHVIFENSEEKVHGDESARVEARLALKKHPNFFPIAFRMDGAFFFPDNHQLKEIPDPLKHVAPSIQPREIKTFKEDFAKQLLGDIKTTGFLITDVVKNKYSSQKEFEDAVKGCIDRVQHMYFSKHTTLDNLGDYQAFILLTYVALIYTFCEKLGISILEVFCKDDLDRGGTIKAILSLDYLYRTGHLNPLILQQILVNLLSAPLIVKKQEILIKRAICLKYVIDVILRAFKEKAQPDIPHAFKGSFSVLTEPCQGILPTGATSRSIDEYQEFLETLKKEPIALSSTSLVQFQAKEAQIPEQDFKKELFEIAQSVFENPWLKYRVERDPEMQAHPQQDLYRSRHETLNLDRAKVPGLSDRSKSMFHDDCGIHCRIIDANNQVIMRPLIALTNKNPYVEDTFVTITQEI